MNDKDEEVCDKNGYELEGRNRNLKVVRVSFCTLKSSPTPQEKSHLNLSPSGGTKRRVRKNKIGREKCIDV